MSEAQTQLAFGGLSPMRIDRLVDRYVTYERVVTAISRYRVKVADHPREMILYDASERRSQLEDLGAKLVFADEPVFPHRLLSRTLSRKTGVGTPPIQSQPDQASVELQGLSLDLVEPQS